MPTGSAAYSRWLRERVEHPAGLARCRHGAQRGEHLQRVGAHAGGPRPGGSLCEARGRSLGCAHMSLNPDPCGGRSRLAGSVQGGWRCEQRAGFRGEPGVALTGFPTRL
jgi:hypothetical protein